jgi:hypothetical protein
MGLVGAARNQGAGCCCSWRLVGRSVAGWLLGNLVRLCRLGAQAAGAVRSGFVITALINAGGSAWDRYNKPEPYDEIAHFFTSFAITLSAGCLLYDEGMKSFFEHRLLFVVAIASLGSALGAL